MPRLPNWNVGERVERDSAGCCFPNEEQSRGQDSACAADLDLPLCALDRGRHPVLYVPFLLGSAARFRHWTVVTLRDGSEDQLTSRPPGGA